MTTLLLSARATDDNQALWRAAIGLGWNVERLRGIALPAGEVEPDVVLYVEALFAPTVADTLGVVLIECAEDWLPQVPNRYRKRDVAFTKLRDARREAGPRFVKPPNDKSFEARVYRCGSELPDWIDEETTVLSAEPVSFEVEYRCFILDRQLRTASPYWRFGQPAKAQSFASPNDEFAEATAFAEELLADPQVSLPKAVALDVGRIAGRGWAVVESNGAWGSGIYGCDPKEVLEVIRHAVRRP